MGRQTIPVNEPNDRWMKEKIQGNEYASKSELINDLIRRQREQEEQRNWLRAELFKGEKVEFRQNQCQRYWMRLKSEQKMANGIRTYTSG